MMQQNTACGYCQAGQCNKCTGATSVLGCACRSSVHQIVLQPGLVECTICEKHLLKTNLDMGECQECGEPVCAACMENDTCSRCIE